MSVLRQAESRKAYLRQAQKNHVHGNTRERYKTCSKATSNIYELRVIVVVVGGGVGVAPVGSRFWPSQLWWVVPHRATPAAGAFSLPCSSATGPLPRTPASCGSSRRQSRAPVQAAAIPQLPRSQMEGSRPGVPASSRAKHGPVHSPAPRQLLAQPPLAQPPATHTRFCPHHLTTTPRTVQRSPRDNVGLPFMTLPRIAVQPPPVDGAVLPLPIRWHIGSCNPRAGRPLPSPCPPVGRTDAALTAGHCALPRQQANRKPMPVARTAVALPYWSVLPALPGRPYYRTGIHASGPHCQRRGQCAPVRSGAAP